MKRIDFTRITVSAFLLISQLTYSQLIGGKTQIWEKVDPKSRNALKCEDENLLNFHCGIKDRIVKKFIRYSKNKSYTLSLVHTSKDVEQIWENQEKKLSLSNNVFIKNGKENLEIARRPSLFTYTSIAEPNRTTSDSLKIKFSDQNLYEMIFIPKRANTKELNNIHSYLSIKYGISLEKGKYYASDGKTLWDPEKHKDYTYRPTGLGRDDGNELYQKQSSNQSDRFLTIGMGKIERTNIENSRTLDNYNFVMWSDDNKDMSLTQSKDLNTLGRTWEINFIGEKVPKTDYQVRIFKNSLNKTGSPLSYWMLLKKDNEEVKKIPGVVSDDYVFFNKVDFLDAFDSTNKTHFTFAVSPLTTRSGGQDIDPKGSNNYGLEDLSIDLEKINLYPNPVKKDQNFTVVFPKMENLVIAIYDAGGRLVKLEKISESATSFLQHLPVQGSYLITLTQSGKIIKTFKLIVD